MIETPLSLRGTRVGGDAGIGKKPDKIPNTSGLNTELLTSSKQELPHCVRKDIQKNTKKTLAESRNWSLTPDSLDLVSTIAFNFGQRLTKPHHTRPKKVAYIPEQGVEISPSKG